MSRANEPARFGTTLLALFALSILWGLTMAAGACGPEPAFARDDAPARRLEAWEGYGARCVIAYNPGGQMASHGSAALACDWNNEYRGEFRRLGSS